MRFIRLLIFIAIIVLLVMAYLNYTPTVTEDGEVADRVASPLQNLQKYIEEKAPNLKDGLDQFQSDIKEHLKDIDLSTLIPKESDEADETEQSDENQLVDWKRLAQQIIEKSPETLKDIEAEELAKHLEEIYGDMKEAIPSLIIKDVTSTDE